ncbi:uncharacterized protein J4E79_010640 [Alternaria viburni]|uniref:uncharacterized protein n=1 Tax=Alternaria viburni TaxID=566460 RepID=UPI0020C255E7|nr:uncharacterized protein J4E79_010640 [Alternaria viburni]KAI4646131.1 hypothetical protein J4E79_010640 [Alternaria viburni]
MGQAQEEEALKATIISHARVIYGPKYPAGSVFDVVTSCEYLSTVSHVVVYPKTKPYSAGEVVSAEHKVVLFSQKLSRVEETYHNLLQHLRSKIAAALST